MESCLSYKKCLQSSNVYYYIMNERINVVFHLTGRFAPKTKKLQILNRCRIIMCFLLVLVFLYSEMHVKRLECFWKKC